MQLMYVWNLILWASLMAFPQEPVKTEMTAAPTYRLLDSQVLPQEGRAYVVSISKPLSVASLKVLVCRVVADEKPSDAHRLSIAIFLNLEQFIPSLNDPVLMKKNDSHRVAGYDWNIGLPNSKQRLSIAMDEAGKPLKKWMLVDFDHTKSCN
jgi:hypothetical protein